MRNAKLIATMNLSPDSAHICYLPIHIIIVIASGIINNLSVLTISQSCECVCVFVDLCSMKYE